MKDYAKRIPRARAVAALDLANALLDYEDDLLQLEQPGDLNEGMGDGTTTVERDVWLEWVALARKSVTVRAPWETLTKRQTAVNELRLKGLTYQQVASRLGISVGRVGEIISAIRRKSEASHD